MTQGFRSNVASLIWLPLGRAAWIPCAMALFRAITALIWGWACRKATTCWAEAAGLEAALGTVSVSSVQPGPEAGGAEVEQVLPVPRAWAIPLHRSRRFCPL